MLVRQIETDCTTGETIERWVEIPDVVTPEAQAVVDAQLAAVKATETTNELTIGAKVDQALAVNDAFLALASPTNAQTLAQVKALTRECSGLIRLLRRKLDSAAGT